jgi:hypothetical protein
MHLVNHSIIDVACCFFILAHSSFTLAKAVGSATQFPVPSGPLGILPDGDSDGFDMG